MSGQSAFALPGLPVYDRTVVMGVLNVTPDSFSDGGNWLTPADAIKHGTELAAEGADIVDVGGESTRPGAGRIDADEELRRTTPVVRALAAEGIRVSIDTTRSGVARAAIDAGAVVVNDVSGGRADPEMAALIARSGVAYVVMHSRGTSADMQQLTQYDDVVRDVRQELKEQLQSVSAAGVRREQLIVDPGIGFAKDADGNLRLLAALPQLGELGLPVLVGASRKSFLGALLDGRSVDERDDATQAITALAAWQGVWGVRVHAARAAADAVRVMAALRSARA